MQESIRKFEGINQDFGWTIARRQYKSKTPILTKLGADQFDRHAKITDLKLKVKKACQILKKQLRTADEAFIDKTLMSGLIKEVVCI